MNDEIPEVIETSPTPTRPARKRWQFGLRSTVLLVAMSALVMSIVVDQKRIAVLKPKVETLRLIARELEVGDPKQTAAVLMPEIWTGEQRWEVYLPEGTKYRLCVATRGVEHPKLPIPSQSIAIASGRQIVSWSQEQTDHNHQIIAKAGPGRLVVEESLDWMQGGVWSGGGVGGVSEQGADSKPIVLVYRQSTVMDPKTKNWVAPPRKDGVMLWIEPEPASLRK